MTALENHARDGSSTASFPILAVRPKRVVHSPDRLNSTLFSFLVKAVCLIGSLIPAANYDGRMMVIGENSTQDAIVLLAADSLIRLELHGLYVCLER
jgi:hypothetical protein